MRKIKVLFVSIAAAFIALFALVSCSGSHATQAYSDKVNNLYSASSAITYTEALKDLGNECIDLTTKTNETHTGVLVAVKGLTKDNYEEKLNAADDNTKFDLIVITVVQDKCTYAHFSVGTKGDVRASLMLK